jgi:hypothetical protein
MLAPVGLILILTWAADLDRATTQALARNRQHRQMQNTDKGSPWRDNNTGSSAGDSADRQQCRRQYRQAAVHEGAGNNAGRGKNAGRGNNAGDSANRQAVATTTSQAEAETATTQRQQYKQNKTVQKYTDLVASEGPHAS